MPELSRFYGIIIRMYFKDHNPPHFHAFYADDEALMEINTLGVYAGKLPARALGLVTEWASLHQAELMAAWDRARNLEPPDRIEPLV